MTDPNRLEELVLRYENTLYRAALAILADPEEARDALQDAFLIYLEKAPAFADEACEKAWLLRVTVNGCKSRLRALRRHPTLPLLDTYPAPDAPRREALEAVMALPPKDRAAIHLFYYEGYQTAEIAAMTGEREGTVRSRLSRARQKLRLQLTQQEELP